MNAVDRGELQYENESLLVTAHLVPLNARSGDVAFIGCVLVFQGQGGFDCQWQGTWKDKQSFVDYLLSSDRFCLDGLANELADEKILSLWSRC